MKIIRQSSTLLLMQMERLSKIMAGRGMCSRREADRYIERGLVLVDGEVISELGTRVPADAVIELAEAGRKRRDAQTTILINKPIGYVSGQPEEGYKAAVSLIADTTRWREDRAPRKFNPAQLRGMAPAGRLDIDSTGLLVLTQDGRVARQIIGEDSSVDKEYLVRVQGTISNDGLRLLNHGLELDGKPLKRAQVSWQNSDQLRFILHEGKKRQIRRMCEMVGLQVVGLKRIRIGKIMLGNLPNGQWRYLREDESF
ncbi:MAG: rRNA pseudouridine synthase [Pontiellaceae bacterium]|nr:rRNA pseudouridine synthase [Pontiellaceae bacterium]